MGAAPKVGIYFVSGLRALDSDRHVWETLDIVNCRLLKQGRSDPHFLTHGFVTLLIVMDIFVPDTLNESNYFTSLLGFDNYK